MALWRSSLGQTAVNVAATTIAAELNSGILKGDDIADRFVEVRDEVFTYLDALADKDDAAYDEPKEKSSGRSERKSSTGGGRKSRGGGKAPSLTDALKLELNSGAFEGETFGTILDLSTKECEDDYGYGAGKKDGRDYIAWAASEMNKNEFTRARAAVIAENEGITPLESKFDD